MRMKALMRLIFQTLQWKEHGKKIRKQGGGSSGSRCSFSLIRWEGFISAEKGREMKDSKHLKEFNS